MPDPTTTVRIPVKLDNRLALLAKRTGRSKTFYARKALEDWLEDQEDYLLAVERLLENNPRVPFDRVVKELGLDD